jgi:diguanylate cyclase (GGDEF)-like protein
LSVQQFSDGKHVGEGLMISLKKYLEMTDSASNGKNEPEGKALLPLTLQAYRSAMAEMGNCGLDVCPPLGEQLRKGLGKLSQKLSGKPSCAAVAETETGVREHLRDWGRLAAGHYREKTNEVKEILLTLAHAAESVGERDQQCAQQFTEVTVRLKGIASLEDLTEIRASIEKSATELRCSIDRMAAEGKAALDKLKAEVSVYQARLEEAELIASRDALTGVRSRPWVESQIEQALLAGEPLCIAIIDIDGFKHVNDEHGHLVGDELLKQFATELQSASRSTDIIGRWGGDEFIILLNSAIAEAKIQTDRLTTWVCGNYSLQGNAAAIKLRVDASIGLAERLPDETMTALVDRADAEMYQHKAASRAARNGANR